MLFYIVAIIFGILLVAYVSYLLFNIMFDMTKGNEPQNTFFPFFKTKKSLTVGKEVADKLNESEAEEAIDDKNATEKETVPAENTALTNVEKEETQQAEPKEPAELSAVDTSVKAREPKKYN